MAETTTPPPTTATIDQKLADLQAGFKQLAAQGGGESRLGYTTPRYGVPAGYTRAGREPGIYNIVTGQREQDGYYDLESMPFTILYGISDDVKREELRKTLFAKGYYRTSKIPTGAVDREDEYAMAELLREANINQTRWDQYVDAVKARPDKVTGGAARPRLTVTSADDIVVIANRLAIETLGRRLKDNEAQTIARLYQAQEQQAGMQAAVSRTSVAAPDVTTTVMNTLETKYGGEQEAYGYLQAANRLARLVGAV
jgi:hypothetical protein